jgi:Tfp pilus assembly protein PilV
MGLVEVIVGLALLAVAVLGINSLAVAMIRGNLSARLNDEATRLAQAKIEQIKNEDFDAAVPGSTMETVMDAAGGTGALFERETKIEPGVLPNTRGVTVTMTWSDQGERHSVFVTEIVK